MQPPPEYFTKPNGQKLAFRHQPARNNRSTIVFLPGYRSDMLGGKAVALSDWAERKGHGMLRLDYSGCGESEGGFEVGTLEIWRDDAQMLIENLVPGPVVLVGSSMGGWIALLLALALPSQVRALVGIAAAPDFTDWGFTPQEKSQLERHGRIERPSDFGTEPMVTTLAFWQSGQDNLLLEKEIAIDCPVRLIQGQHDDVVPWLTAVRISDTIRSADVQAILIKEGDHRLSRDADIELLIATITSVMDF